MEKVRSNFFEGISINMLKVIGMITMFIDHVAVYFSYKITPEVYLICRLIGRISMPLFVFILVQGYMHTRNLKKYMIRIGVLAIITQVLSLILGYINKIYYPNYVNELGHLFNILFSFVLSLILIRAFDIEKKYINKFNRYINFILRLLIVICVVIIYCYINVDYSFTIPVMAINFFLFEKIKTKLKTEEMKTVFTGFEMIIMLIIAIVFNRMEMLVVVDVPILFLYNGKKKNKFDFNRLAMYAFFPLHHFVLYLIAMLIGG